MPKTIGQKFWPIVFYPDLEIKVNKNKNNALQVKVICLNLTNQSG